LAGGATGEERLAYIDKEKDQESNLGVHGVRKYDYETGRFTSTDVLWEKYAGWSPYHYSHNNPISRKDGNGLWDINVTLPKDRNKQGVAVVTDRHGNEVMRFSVLGRGIAGRNRLIENADTPLGVYDIPNKGMWILSTPDKRNSYGPNPRLILIGESGEIIKSKRKDIRFHGGRQEEELLNGKWIPLENPTLKTTRGCLRAFDAEMLQLYNITNELMKSDPEEKGGKTYVNEEQEKENDVLPANKYISVPK